MIILHLLSIYNRKNPPITSEGFVVSPEFEHLKGIFMVTNIL